MWRNIKRKYETHLMINQILNLPGLSAEEAEISFSLLTWKIAALNQHNLARGFLCNHVGNKLQIAEYNLL